MSINDGGFCSVLFGECTASSYGPGKRGLIFQTSVLICEVKVIILAFQGFYGD